MRDHGPRERHGKLPTSKDKWELARVREKRYPWEENTIAGSRTRKNAHIEDPSARAQNDSANTVAKTTGLVQIAKYHDNGPAAETKCVWRKAPRLQCVQELFRERCGILTLRILDRIVAERKGLGCGIEALQYEVVGLACFVVPGREDRSFTEPRVCRFYIDAAPF